MSKMDALRAMREARYEAAHAAKPATAKTPGTSPKTAAKTPVKAAAKAAAGKPADDVEPVTEDRLCGHKNMSGRTCTREHGHAAKSHRYS